TLEPFSRAGWRVYAFEPDPENRAILEQHIKRSGLKNVIVDERALGDCPGELSFFKSDVSKGISSLLDFHESHTAIGKVKVTTLNDFLRSQGIHKIDFLKTDAEGYDLKILQGIDLDTYQPEVILREFEDAKTTKLDYTVRDTAAYLHQHQYRILFSEWYPIRQYGTRHQWKRFTTDMEQLDPKAWGNIIAVRPAHFDRLCQLSKKI
ncbi:MAG: FkbM family methyltransferase, partial [Phaeodactylibacter sp.]|nr:FkbM family methyltransferase [Phaeodactylibacter sp.]